MLFSWIKYTDMEGEAFPDWADALGWLMTLTVVVAIIGGMIYAITVANGEDFGEVDFLMYGSRSTWGIGGPDAPWKITKKYSFS